MSKTYVTRGRGYLGRIYERLRKRSLRRRNQHVRFLWDHDATESSSWFQTEHEAYVQGVRDALKTVERDGRWA